MMAFGKFNFKQLKFGVCLVLSTPLAYSMMCIAASQVERGIAFLNIIVLLLLIYIPIAFLFGGILILVESFCYFAYPRQTK